MKKMLFIAFLCISLGIPLIFSDYSSASLSGGPIFLSQEETPVKGEGTENRDWVTKKENLTFKPYRVKVKENIEITMRDGTLIRARLLMPDGLDEPLPTIVKLNGYGYKKFNKKSEANLIDLAERGYAVVHVSMRGTGSSEGKAGLYNGFGNDGYDIIEWAAAQEWSNGKVGTVGTSLLGISQWMAAKERPPSLKAISPVVACANCYETLWHPGGLESGPGRIKRSIEFEAAKKHRNFDDWWKERTLSDKQLEEVADHGVAAFISAGWNDYISPGNIDAFEKFSQSGGQSKLIVSAGAHSSLAGVLPYSFADYQASWFDYFLKGVDNGVAQRAPVLIYVQGANQWRYEEEWPLHDVNYVDLYFNDRESKTIKSLQDGSFTLKKSESKKATANYTYSPEIGPFLPTLLSRNGRVLVNQQPYEKQTVTWTTDAFAVPTEVTGNISVDFWASINAQDADFVAQLTDVAPDGTSKQVTAGYLNASRANSRTKPMKIKPGKIEEYKLDIFPTSYVFKKGHRIRLSLAGGAKAYPGQFSPQGPGLNQTSSTVRIHQGSTYPSRLRLPIIGLESLKMTSED